MKARSSSCFHVFLQARVHTHTQARMHACTHINKDAWRYSILREKSHFREPPHPSQGWQDEFSRPGSHRSITQSNSQSPCPVLISQTTRPRFHSVNGSNSPQKVFLGPQTRSGLSGQLRGNWWVCFISESDAVEKLLQTPRPKRRVGPGVTHV